MTSIVLPVEELKEFPHTRLRSFLNRGTVEAAAYTIFRWLGGKTYEEWFEYFVANDFAPKNWLEVPIFAKVIIYCYQGMVLEAEDAAKSWQSLSEIEREEYKQEALAIAMRERFTDCQHWKDITY